MSRLRFKTENLCTTAHDLASTLVFANSMSELERKQKDDVAVYSRPADTDNPNVKRRQGAKTIVPTASPQDNALNPADASLPEATRYTALLKGNA